MQNQVLPVQSPLQLELNKLIQTTSYFESQQQSKIYLLGYLSNHFKITTKINLKIIHKLLDHLFNAINDQLIVKENTLEIVAIIVQKFRCDGADQKRKEKIIEEVYKFFQFSFSELVLDNKYLFNKYFDWKLVELVNKKSQMMGIQCPICACEVSNKGLCMLTCDHIFHKQCLNIYSQQKIKIKDLPILCPEQDCKNQITQPYLKQFLSTQTLLKLQQFTFHTYIDKNLKHTSWCPTAGCSGVFEFDETLIQYRCPVCKKHYCLSCKVQYHVGFNCNQYRQMANLSETDKNFLKMVNDARYKQCPNCKFWVEKSEGCDHMTCRCKYQFCYKCGAQYGTCDCEEDDYDEQEEDYQSDVDQVEQPPYVEEIRMYKQQMRLKQQLKEKQRNEQFIEVEKKEQQSTLQKKLEPLLKLKRQYS